MTNLHALAAEPRPEVEAELIDELIDAYVDWREESISLDEAYARWAYCAVEERSLAFAAYGAAFDRESQACRTYAVRVERVERELALAGADERTPRAMRFANRFVRRFVRAGRRASR